MARPREFDREKALQDAMRVFWAKGFGGASTEELLQALGIGRQSLYNAFGDKRALYLEAFALYLQNVTAAHLARLNGHEAPLDGIRDLLTGLTRGKERHLGCMGVCSVAEFGPEDAEVASLRRRSARLLSARLVDRIKEGQARGELDACLDPAQAASFVQVTMTGLQVAARAGAGPSELAALAGFAVTRLQNP